MSSGISLFSTEAWLVPPHDTCISSGLNLAGSQPTTIRNIFYKILLYPSVIVEGATDLVRWTFATLTAPHLIYRPLWHLADLISILATMLLFPFYILTRQHSSDRSFLWKDVSCIPDIHNLSTIRSCTNLGFCRDRTKRNQIVRRAFQMTYFKEPQFEAVDFLMASKRLAPYRHEMAVMLLYLFTTVDPFNSAYVDHLLSWRIDHELIGKLLTFCIQNNRLPDVIKILSNANLTKIDSPIATCITCHEEINAEIPKALVQAGSEINVDHLFELEDLLKIFERDKSLRYVPDRDNPFFKVIHVMPLGHSVPTLIVNIKKMLQIRDELLQPAIAKKIQPIAEACGLPLPVAAIIANYST